MEIMVSSPFLPTTQGENMMLPSEEIKELIDSLEESSSMGARTMDSLWEAYNSQLKMEEQDRKDGFLQD